jgi:hypothetical protein
MYLYSYVCTYEYRRQSYLLYIRTYVKSSILFDVIRSCVVLWMGFVSMLLRYVTMYVRM